MADFHGTNDNDTYRQSHETRGFGIPEADVGTINTFGGTDRVSTRNYGTYTINTGNGTDYVDTTAPIIWDDFRTDGAPDSILISSYNMSLGNGDDWLTLSAAQGSFDGGSGVDSLRISSQWDFYNAFGKFPTTFLDITGEDEFPGIYVDLANGIARSSGYPSLRIATQPGAEDPWSLGGGGLFAFDVVISGFENVVTFGGDDTLLGSAAREEFFSPGDGANTVNGRGGLDWLTIFTYISPDSETGSATLDLEAKTYIGTDGKTSTFSNIERFVLGSGGDTVLGSRGDDYVFDSIGPEQSGRLVGGQGYDILYLYAYQPDQGLVLDLQTGVVDIRDAADGTTPGTTEINGWEEIHLSPDRDIAHGSDGDDLIYGEDGVDQLNGQGGMDMLHGGAAKDILKGGAGKDTLFGDEGADVLLGGAGADSLIGGKGADEFDGGGGIDTVDYGQEDGTLGIEVDLSSDSAVDTHGTTDSGFKNIDIIRGTDLADKILGNDENNIFHAGRATDGNDELRGGLGDDTLYGDYGINGLYGQGGDDTLIGGTGQDFLYGGGNDDKLDGRNGKDTIEAGGGNDDIILSKGVDKIDGGSGSRDRMFLTPEQTPEIKTPNLLGKKGAVLDLDAGTYKLGSFGSGTVENVEIFIGTEGNDDLFGRGPGSQKDTLKGENGNDAISGGGGDDILEGGGGDDGLSGGKGDDKLYGDARPGSVAEARTSDGKDDLSGGGGDDQLFGGGKKDILKGGNGDDKLDGGSGNDTMTGGRDEDVFYFSKGHDIITDFSKDYDPVDFFDEKDVIALYGGTYTPGFANFKALKNAASQSGSDVVINHREGSLTIEGLQLSDLSKDMFDFA